MNPDIPRTSAKGESSRARSVPFQTITPGQAISALGSRREGLDPDEAAMRLQEYGPNTLREKRKKSAVLLLLRQFTDLLIVILVIAAIISGLLGEWVDAYAILFIVLLNGVIGFIQEYRAERALETLKQMTAPQARVMRAGKEMPVDAAGLVPGDIILIAEGDRVPADARLVEVVALEADEAMLTGESVPVHKDAGPVLQEGQPLSEQVNMVFQGTVVTRGRGLGVITRTGMETELGKIATSVVDQPEARTPLQEKLGVLGTQLSIAAIGLVFLIFVLGVLHGFEPFEIFLISVSLAVAAIPEGLPAVVTITLAIGVQRMATRHAVIRRLPAVETLGAATVICTDKTGTLTKNEMTVRRLFVDRSFMGVTGEGYSVKGELILDDGSEPAADSVALRELLAIGVLCNTSRLTIDSATGTGEIAGDPTEAALLVLAEKAGLDHQQVRKESRCEEEIPFDPVRKMMTVICLRDGRRRAFVKGAPEIVLARCDRILRGGNEVPLAPDDRENVLRVINHLGGEALRVLGFAYRNWDGMEGDNPEEDLVFVGLTGMMDPPRPEARSAIQACHEAGIRIVMITGDNPETARAIARELGLSVSREVHVVTGAEMDTWSDAKCMRSVREDTVFARVNPEHKLRIVNALQACGEVVAMTGDGVNDAPAIVKADIGIAMGLTGTMVTKEVSDMVVTDDNFASIERAVEEGRVIYENILKTVRYLISCNSGELAAITVAMLAGLASPLSPLQILWMNIVTDSPPALALAMDPRDPDIMKRLPHRPGEQILTWRSSTELLGTGLVMALGTIGVFAGYLAAGPEYAVKAGTMAFSVIIISQMFLALAFSGSREKSLTETGVFRNPWLWFSVGFGIASQLVITEWGPFRAVFGTVSLGPADWLIIILVSLAASVVPGGAKLVRRHRSAQG
jgi:Ca2+-transporting ATPase